MLLALVACTPVADAKGPAVPARAGLSRDGLTVTLTDGTRCAVPFGTEGSSASGRMAACGAGMGFAIRTLDAGSLARMSRSYAKPLMPLGANPPLAEVILTDPAGIDHIFLSP